MMRSSRYAFWLLALTAFSWTASGAESRQQFRVGLILVAADAQDTPPPTPAQLDYPASPSAVLCRSDISGYRECRTPFRGRVALSRELDATRCVEGRNWGWREGAVWVDGGCAAIFLKEGASTSTPTA